MKKSVLLSAMGLVAISAGAQEMGRVVSSTPVVQQVAVPRQVCNNQPIAAAQGTSGAGGLVGALVGGALGNTIGHGGGRAAATMLGVIGGAMLGNQAEANNLPPQSATNCTTQTTYESRTVAYDVTYEYGGRQYTVQMANDPGANVPLQVAPVGATGGSRYAQAPGVVTAPPVGAEGTVVATAPTYVAPPVYQAAPVYAYPAAPVVYYQPSPYYYAAPLAIGLGLYAAGAHYHRHSHHRHYRRWR